MRKLKLATVAALCLATSGAWATDYVWKSTIESGSWSDYSNWQIDDGLGNLSDASSGQYPVSSSDRATFNSAASVTYRSTKNEQVGTLILNANVTLSGNGGTSYDFIFDSISGTGEIILNGARIRANGTATVANSIRIQGGEGNQIRSTKGEKPLTLTGSLLGSGSVTITATGTDNGTGVRLEGDTSKFSGIATIFSGSAARPKYYFNSANAIDNTLSSWTLNVSGATKSGNQNFSGYFLFQLSNQTYKFGSLNGYYSYCSMLGNTDKNLQGVTIEIGNRDEDCSFSGDVQNLNQNIIFFSSSFTSRVTPPLMVT